ncbi:MAG TPA: N-acetyl-gamma-glutamyl-phosphate reductase [bacterium]|nr:N-acetyl-gamma-glutamyl-phosphate reductase [bacterium]
MTDSSLSKKIRCAVIGASGYAGLETVRLLAAHPNAEIVFVTSNTYKGSNLADQFPYAGAPGHLVFSPHESAADFDGADVFFLALPHGKSYGLIEPLLGNGKVVDISADYRLSDPADYEKWYGYKHPKPELLEKAAFGLCEIYRDKIKGAALVANPGCYPTSIALALHPLSKIRDIVGGPIICDSKSGYSGAGRSPKPHLMFSEAFGEFAPYAVTGHRHTSEMLQEASAALGRKAALTFTPHLIPVPRGILSTIYVPLVSNADPVEINGIYTDFYKDENFVNIATPDKPPSIKKVNGTNNCMIGIYYDSELKMLKLISAIDNLLKGAAGQAVQNMNILFDLPEETGLRATPLMP